MHNFKPFFIFSRDHSTKALKYTFVSRYLNFHALLSVGLPKVFSYKKNPDYNFIFLSDFQVIALFMCIG